MANHNYSLWSVPTLLIAVITVTVGAGVPISAQAATISLTNQKKIEVQKGEEARLKKMDPSYKNQAIALANQYKKTAKLVKSRGGDPKPLLDAAAYFDNQAK